MFECTIAEGTFVAAQPRADARVVVRNEQLSPEDSAVPVALLRQPGLSGRELAAALKDLFPHSRWQLYVVGVLFWIAQRYPALMFADGRLGISLLLRSSVPLNRGVSSSASVEVATMKAAAAAFGISIQGEALATACQWVENEVCSSACGLMDQMAVTLGSPFMCMRCQPAQILPSPPLPSDLTVFAMDSGVSHEVSGIECVALFLPCGFMTLFLTILSHWIFVTLHSDTRQRVLRRSWATRSYAPCKGSQLSKTLPVISLASPTPCTTAIWPTCRLPFSRANSSDPYPSK